MNRERAKELLPIIEHFANGGDVQYQSGCEFQWHLMPTPCWDDEGRYRKAVTKPSIDWSHVAPEFKWLTVDDDTRPQMHTDEPRPSGEGVWCRPLSEGAIGDRITVTGFASFKPGTCDWKDSKVERPSS